MLVAKPLTAFLIVWALRYSVRSALTVAVALAQIGEFSFLLADEAMRDRLLPAEGHSLLVACAILSITLNPLLFRAIDPLERWLRSKPRLWRVLSRRSEAGGAELNLGDASPAGRGRPEEEQPVTAVIVGYGPVGQTACRILKEFGVRPVVVDLNLDTVRGLAESGQLAVYGDATQRDILEAAGIREAKYLLVTVPEVLVADGGDPGGEGPEPGPARLRAGAVHPGAGLAGGGRRHRGGHRGGRDGGGAGRAAAARGGRRRGAHPREIRRIQGELREPAT